MSKFGIAIAATVLANASAMASAPDWWLVSGEPGSASVQFINASSIRKTNGSVSFHVATYWGNGRNMERQLSISCNETTVGTPYSDLQQFACGSEETRMSTGLKLGSQNPEWVAKTVMSMPSSDG